MPSETVEALSAPVPVPPARQYSFTGWQVSNPTTPPPGDRLDAEYDRLRAAILRVIDWVEASLARSVSRDSVGDANAASDAAGSAALAQDYAVLTQAWAEHMPDTIPPNILAVMDVTGDHWSSRWWANHAALIIRGQIVLLNAAGLANGQPDGSPPAGAIPGDLYNSGGFICIARASDGTTGGGPALSINLAGIPVASSGGPPGATIAGDLYCNGGFVCIALAPDGTTGHAPPGGTPPLPVDGRGLPTSTAGLLPGAYWNNGGFVCLVT